MTLCCNWLVMRLDMSDFVTPKTVSDVFGADFEWLTDVMGARPSKAAIKAAVDCALAARKRPQGGNVEFMAWVLYARPAGATASHVQVACNSGPAFNKVRAAHKARKLVFTQAKAGPGEPTVYHLSPLGGEPITIPAPKPAKAAKRTKAAKAAKVDAKVDASA